MNNFNFNFKFEFASIQARGGLIRRRSFFVTGRWVYNLGGSGGGWGGAINGKAYKWKFTVCLKNDT